MADVETALQSIPLKRSSVYTNVITKFISKVMKGTLGCSKTAQFVPSRNKIRRMGPKRDCGCSDFHKRILFSDEAHFWLNGYVNKQNCRIWSEANPQVYVETPLHPEKLTVSCALWAGGILLQKR
ncbi:hypothetical protein TNCV_1341 [Trichonephila clavipes]|nr:hypothetical protein TNCV_1341 [Trichonephila clavipes]